MKVKSPIVFVILFFINMQIFYSPFGTLFFLQEQ